MLCLKAARYPRRARKRHEDPEGHDREARVAESLPVEAEAPWLHEEQQQQRADRLGVSVDRHVDERLRFQLDVSGERKEQDLARGLVDRVTERLVEHPRESRRPQAGVEQHDDGARAEAHRQHHQGEADAEIAMDLAGEPDLDDEPERRHPELRPAQGRP